ncbi:MAG TPA: tandem-95 repeat protein, partial [Urbifossiella sp.]|nr:tandem-95 repeat protein [Urbifossiella sp.]
IVAGLLGTAAGQPGYSAAADADRDGTISASDVQLLAANYGFLPTRPPAAQPGQALTHTGLPVKIDLAPLAADPQGEHLFFRVTGATNGTATLDPDGHTVTFVPAAGFTGAAQFEYQADDGLEVSAPAAVAITVSAAPLVGLDFQTRDPHLAVGTGAQVEVVGDFADQSGVPLAPSYVTFSSTNPAALTVTASGGLTGVARGAATLIATAQGVQAVTAVVVGTPTDGLGQELVATGLNVYPPAVALSSTGGTRQIDVHPGGDAYLGVDLSGAATGTRYYLSRPGVVAVGPDGLIRAVAPGTVTITVINGPAESRIDVLVQTPQTGVVPVGPAGGVVAGSDGSVVGVPAGVLPAGTPVSITPKTLADLPQAPPGGFGFAAAFQLDIGDDVLGVPVQLSIPVPSTIPVGSTVVFYRAGQTLDATGQTVPVWWESENGVVGADGMAHTNSPPEHGSHSSGLYVVVPTGLSTFNPLNISVQIDNIVDQAANFFIGSPGGGLTGIAATVDATGIHATMAYPVTPQPEPLLLQRITPVGLPTTITLGNVRIDPNAGNTFATTITAPPPAAGATPPVITAVKEGVNTTDGSRAYPEVVLTGHDFTTPNPGQPAIIVSDLRVVFQMPGVHGVREVVQPSAASTSTELHVPIPNDIVVGLAAITVLRPDTVNARSATDDIVRVPSPTPSNAAQLDPSGSYVFVTATEYQYHATYTDGALLVLNGDPAAKDPVTGASTFNQIVATIPLGLSQTTPDPIQVAVTPDNTRAYVTEYGNGSVAVVDTVSLQEVNVNARAAAAAPINPADWDVTGVRLDPALDGTLVTGPTDIVGTVNVPDLVSWSLTLTGAAGQSVPLTLTASPTANTKGAVLTRLDPTGLADGWYHLELTATTPGGTQEKDVWLEVAANPVQKAIHLPGASAPYGIAIDPQGNYAYVVDGLPHLVDGKRTTFVYQIDVNPASPTYNSVVGTIYLGTSDTAAQTAQQQIAPTGGRQVTVSADGLHVFVTAPNYFYTDDPTNPPTHPDPNAPPNARQAGNLIEITLTQSAPGAVPQKSVVSALPGSEAPYGVATIPSTNDVIFTNSESDAYGAETTHLGDGTKQPIPFNLDASSTAAQQLLSVHSPHGIAVFTYTNPTTGKAETYAFVAGRADVVNHTFYISQDDFPLYEGGSIGVIKDPYGPNPQLITSTRPIPDSYPTDLALSADGKYLYVSYQGLAVQLRPPVVDASGNLVMDPSGFFPVDDGIGHGGLMVFNAAEIVRAIDNPDNQKYYDYVQNKLVTKPTNNSYSLFSLYPIDDLYVSPGATNLSGVSRQINAAIDVQAEYDRHTEFVYDGNGNPVYSSPGVKATRVVFGIPNDDPHLGQSNPNGPIGLGFRTGGIAAMHGFPPHVQIVQSTAAALGSINLPRVDDVEVVTRVDATNGSATTTGGAFSFSLDHAATVTLLIDGAPAVDLPGDVLYNLTTGATYSLLSSFEKFQDVQLDPGVYTTNLALDPAVATPGTYSLLLTAVTPDGESGSATAQLVHTIEEDATYPVAHTIVKGVDISDGHLTMSAVDVSVPGRGLDLTFARSYSSAGNESGGPLGAGWTDNYNVTLADDNDGHYTVIGGDGSGNTFATGGTPDPVLAAVNAARALQFGLPAGAQFFNPQIGYHSSLARYTDPATGRAAFDFFTPADVRYHFVLQPGQSPLAADRLTTVYRLGYIEDANGNKITLYYGKQDPGAAALAQPFQDAFAANGDTTLVKAVTDSSGRALLFKYQFIFNAYRIVAVTGYDPEGTGLGGLNVEYNYDEPAPGAAAGAPAPVAVGNLTSVVRKDGAAGAVLRKEAYVYTAGDGPDGHNLIRHVEPNGFDAGGNPVPDYQLHTTTYSYYQAAADAGLSLPTDFHFGAPTVSPNYIPFLKASPKEVVSQISEPGGDTTGTTGSAYSVTKFGYTFSTNPATPNTRTVTDPRDPSGQTIPATAYVLDTYGATTEIDAPDGDGHAGAVKTVMVWNMDQPDPSAVPARADGRPDVQLLKTIDPVGRETDYKYDALGNVIAQTVKAPARAGYAAVTTPTGTIVGSVTTTATYDPLFGRKTSETDAEGHTTFYVYDDTAFPAAASTGGPPPALPPLQNGVALPTPTGLTGNLLATVDAVGDVTRYEYSTAATYAGGYGPGDLEKMTDPRGFVTTYRYDAYGNATQTFTQTDPADVSHGVTTTQTFDARSRVVTMTDTFGHHVDYVYDGLDRVQREVQFDDQNAQAYSHSLPEDGDYPLPPTDAGRAWAEETITRYLPEGETAETINGMGQHVLYAYDAANRLISQTTPDIAQADGSTTAIVTTYEYDAGNNATDEYDLRDGPGSTPIHRHTSYDDLNRPVEVDVFGLVGPTIPNPVLRTHYDLAGNKQYEIDLHGNRTGYSYDWLFRVTDVLLPLTGPALTVSPDRHTAYDRVGNVLSQTDADDHATLSTYDAANRLKSQIDPVGNEVDYGYDPSGNVILETHKSPLVPTIWNGAKQVTYVVATPVIDGLGRPGEVDQTVYLGDPTAGATVVTYTTTYQYLDSLNTILVTDPRGNDPTNHVSGQTKTAMDGLDRVHTEIVDVGGLNLTTTAIYDQGGNAARVTDPAGTFDLNTYDGLGRLITSQDELNPAEQFFYNGSGQVVKDVDKRGIVFTTTYDALDRVLTQNVREDLSNGGRWLALSTSIYNDALNQVTAKDADGNATVTQYDEIGRPLTVTDPYGNAVVSVYDGVNLVKQTDKNHNVTAYAYDDANRPVRTDEYGASSQVMTSAAVEYHDAENQIVNVGPRAVDGESIRTVRQNDSLGRTISEGVQSASLAAGYGTGTVTLERDQYDGDGNVIASFDAGGNETTSVFDGAGRQVAMTEGANDPAVAATTLYTYDAVGDLVSTKGPRAHAGPSQPFPSDPANPAPAVYFDTYSTYDVLHRKLTDTDGAGDTTRYAYDAGDDVRAVTDPRGNTTLYTYDELGKVLSADETHLNAGTGQQGGITYYRYDGNRNKIAQQDANGNLVTHYYDKLNRLTDTYQYLTPGTITGASTRPAQGATPTPPQTVARHWQIGYDASGNQTTVTDPKGQVTTMTYDYRDRLATTAYSHFADVAAPFQPLSITYQYDPDNNLTLADETKAGANGNPSSPVRERTASTFDALDRTTQSIRDDDAGAVDDVVTRLRYTYDRQGNVKSVSDPGPNQPLPTGTPAPGAGTTTYDFDARNRMAVVHTGAGDTQYAYYPDGLVSSVQYPDGTVADSSYADSYDAAGRLVHLVNHRGPVGLDPVAIPAQSDQLISSFRYGYDADSDRTYEAEAHSWLAGGTTQTTAYQYDQSDRLTDVSYTSGAAAPYATLHYTYDKNGNRLTETGNDPANPTRAVNRVYAYDRLNEVASATDRIDPTQSVAYTYDLNGNRTSKIVGQNATANDANGNPVVTLLAPTSTKPYVYNVVDELAQTADAAGNAIRFGYDVMGMRDRQISTDGETRYLYGIPGLLLQYSGTGQTQTQYNFGIQLISDDSPAAGEQFYFTDALGSVSELIGGSGVAQGFQYDPWGTLLASASPTSSGVQYTGQYADTSSGLDYYGSRYYDPALGSFITQDSALGSDCNPTTLNRYLYVSDNPLRYIDPTGHEEAKVNLPAASNTICNASGDCILGTPAPPAPPDDEVEEVVVHGAKRVARPVHHPDGVDETTKAIYLGGVQVGRVVGEGKTGTDAIDPNMFFNTNAPGMDVLAQGSSSPCQAGNCHAPPQESSPTWGGWKQFVGDMPPLTADVARKMREGQARYEDNLTQTLKDIAVAEVAAGNGTVCPSACHSLKSIKGVVGNTEQMNHDAMIMTMAMATIATIPFSVEEVAAAGVVRGFIVPTVGSWAGSEAAYHGSRYLGASESTANLIGFAGGLVGGHPFTTRAFLPAASIATGAGETSALARALARGQSMSVTLSQACFVAGTRVIVRGETDQQFGPTGPDWSCSKRIEDLTPGDMVLGKDVTRNQLLWQRVLETFSRRSDHVRILSIRSAHAEDSVEIRTTNEHPFWVEGPGWVRAADVPVGAVLTQSDGEPATVVASAYAPCPSGLDVYNIEVEGQHNYFVTDPTGSLSPILVHNASICNAGLGEAAEGLVKNLLQEHGFTEVRSLANASGNGLDVVGRDAEGFWHIFEVKANTSELTAAQQDPYYFEGQLERLAFGELSGRGSAELGLGAVRSRTWRDVYADTQAFARRVLSGIQSDGFYGRYNVRVSVKTTTGVANSASVVVTPRPLKATATGSDDTAVSGALEAAAGTEAAEAMSFWSSLMTSPIQLDLTVQFDDLPVGLLGEARIDAVGIDGLPTAGTIILSRNAAGVGWFIDPTPQDRSEFGEAIGADAFLAKPDSQAAGKYDLETVLLHEIGHLLGFNSDIPGFASRIGTVSGSQVFVGANFTASLTPAPDDDHLDPDAYPHDLMAPLLTPGERRRPSALDAQIIRTVRWGVALPTSIGSIGTDASPLSRMPHGGGSVFNSIVNGDFLVGDPADPGFGWTAHGAAVLGGGHAVLSEDPDYMTGLSQTFTVPTGADTLQVVINRAAFQTNGPDAPPDAFELALLDAATGMPVVGTAGGLTDTDAFLNIQTDGTTYFSPLTQVSGVAGSGGVASLADPLTVTVDVHGIAPGTQLTLYADLLGFGATTSSVTLDSVTLLGNSGEVQPPVAVDDAYSTDENTTLTVPPSGVLTNDTDPQGLPQHAVVVTGPVHGSLSLAVDGSFVYTPAAGFSGNDRFTYKATDGTADSAPATATITVNFVNQVPVFTAGTAQTANENAGPQTVAGWATGISAGPPSESGQH